MSRSTLSAWLRSLTLLASVGAPSLALAADLLPPPPEPLPPPVEIGGGWYLRGDVGVGAAYADEIITTTKYGALPDGYRFDQKTVGDQFFAGGGVGYQFGPFFRADVTAEYRGGAKLNFSDSYNTYDQYGQIYNPDGSPYKSINYYNGHLSSVVVMANGYIDLGTWYGVTPFVGGGVGVALHRVSGFTDFGAGGAAGGFGYASDKHSSSLAWSAQAGLSYSVTPNVKLDLGYRFINLGHATTGVVSCFNDPGCSYATYKVKEITSHDVKLGMRWLFDAGIAAPLPALAPDYPPPGPVVRKY